MYEFDARLTLQRKSIEIELQTKRVFVQKKKRHNNDFLIIFILHPIFWYSSVPSTPSSLGVIVVVQWEGEEVVDLHSLVMLCGIQFERFI